LVAKFDAASLPTDGVMKIPPLGNDLRQQKDKETVARSRRYAIGYRRRPYYSSLMGLWPYLYTPLGYGGYRGGYGGRYGGGYGGYYGADVVYDYSDGGSYYDDYGDYDGGFGAYDYGGDGVGYDY